MASAADLSSAQGACPWEREDFRADLELLSGGTAAAARMFAADLRVVARLAGRVPRVPFDETGASPWTSFRREVAVARKVTDRAAARVIRCALRLTSVLPVAMGQLEAGVLTQRRAEVFVAELDQVDDTVAAAVDAELGEIIGLLPVWRIENEVRRAVLRLDPDAAAARVAEKNACRSVELLADVDDQALVTLSGPAVPLTRWYATVDARARALKAAGDPRTLDALRFDLATNTFPCDAHAPVDPMAVDNTPDPGSENPGGASSSGDSAAQAASTESSAAGLRPSFVEPALADCRRSRPVQARVMLPVETTLGLSNEPGWLDGYGWISAATCRTLLVDAELRQVCVRTGTGELVDLPPGTLRPEPTPQGVRQSLLSMVLSDVQLSDVGWRTEPQHDPSDRLREFVTVRDKWCDGPTGTRTPASRTELDHDTPWPEGPTAAWNLVARATRTHQLKHHGWTPLRTSTATVWVSPTGQSVEVPRQTSPPPGLDPAPDGHPPLLPDPDLLADLDQQQLTPARDHPPAFAPDLDHTDWTWLGGSADPPPF